MTVHAWAVDTADRNHASTADTLPEAWRLVFGDAEDLVRAQTHATITITVDDHPPITITPAYTDAGPDQDTADTLDALQWLRYDVLAAHAPTAGKAP